MSVVIIKSQKMLYQYVIIRTNKKLSTQIIDSANKNQTVWFEELLTIAEKSEDKRAFLFHESGVIEILFPLPNKAK